MPQIRIRTKFPVRKHQTCALVTIYVLLRDGVRLADTVVWGGVGGGVLQMTRDFPHLDRTARYLRRLLGPGIPLFLNVSEAFLLPPLALRLFPNSSPEFGRPTWYSRAIGKGGGNIIDGCFSLLPMCQRSFPQQCLMSCMWPHKLQKRLLWWRTHIHVQFFRMQIQCPGIGMQFSKLFCLAFCIIFITPSKINLRDFMLSTLCKWHPRCSAMLLRN
jgi:hypothetical protein